MMDKNVNYTFNSLANLCLRRMKRYGSLCKVLHASPEVIDSTSDNDLVLFVLYSLNKQKRWEVCDQVDESFLDHLYELNDRMETLVLDRRFDDSFRAYWAHIVPHFYHVIIGAKIRNCYEKRGVYKESHFSGAGTFLGGDKKKKKEETSTIQVITYNIVRAPRNYQKIFAHSFRNYPRSKDSTYRRKGQYDTRTVRLDWGEYRQTDSVDLDEDVVIQDDLAQPSIPKFYNLYDHFVISTKRRKTKCKTETRDGFVFIQ